MDRKSRQSLHTVVKTTGMCVILPFSLALSSATQANEPEPIAGIIDGPVIAASRADIELLKEQVRKEQGDLAKKDRGELEKRAESGERLAQVALGADFATEAQQLLYAPAAANAANSDALAWYSLAAQRGVPDAPSLDHIGVRFHPIRIVRNK